MCNLCDGTSFEDQRRSLQQRFHEMGWTSVFVEPDERSLGYGYTIGMTRVGHPELVLVDEPPEVVARVFETLAPQILAGRTLEAGTRLELLGRSWSVLPIHRSQVRAGLLAWWPDVFPHCSCHSEPAAVQLIDDEVRASADDEGTRRLDQPARPAGGRAGTRAERRRQERADAKRRRQG
jgi:hypothetical protein